MEGKPIPQSREWTERSHRRKLSSILKATHSPLIGATSGNEPTQDPATEKRQKSSRRVSFAETIRVFTPELQAAGSDEKENEGYGISNSSSNINKGEAAKCAIAGMDTLLHGPIQAPGHSSDWNYTECAKDRTIVFSSDSDMDMTASNTVTIHGLTEEGTEKIDAKQFLASLKSQNGQEVAKMQNFPLSTGGGDKNPDFKEGSSMKSINVSDFLASLGGENSKPTGLCDHDKTVLFSCGQQDMDMTRSHTVSIDSKVLNEISQRPNANTLKQKSPKFNKQSEGCLENKTLASDWQEKTFLYEQNDMDITRSHTTSIENKILEGVKAENVSTELPVTERSMDFLTVNAGTSGIRFEDEDMDTTKSNPAEASRAPRTTLLHNTLSFRPHQDDMDMTYSHTVTIKNTFLHGHSQLSRSVPHVPSTSKGSASDKTVFEDDMELTKSHTMIINEINQLALDNQSLNLRNITPDNVGTGLKMGPEVDTAHKVSKQRLHNETVHQEGEMDMTNVGGGLLLAAGKSQVGNPEFEALHEKTLYLCDLDDMDMTRAHTVAIENKVIAEVGHRWSQSNTTLSATSGSKSHLRDVKCTRKPHFVPDGYEMRYRNRPLCDQDMDVTASNTVVIGSREPGNDAQTTGPKSRILSSINKSENRDDNVFGKQSRNLLETNSLVSGESQDKTLYLYEQNDMDITRSHTTAIKSKILEGVMATNVTRELPNTKRKSVLDVTTHPVNTADDIRSGKSFQGEDMDITRSGTVFIDHISESDKPCSKGDVLLRESISSCPKSLVPSDKTILPICNIKQPSFDKTVCNEGDMEMTRSYTVAIEGKILDVVKAKNVTAEFLDATREPVPDRTINAVRADDLTSRICFQGEDMDITRSNTVFIDQMSDILHIKNTPVSDRLSKRKSVSYCPKSLVSSDETIRLDFNMEETNANVDLTEILEDKTSIDKTICCQGDMEMTRSHTVAIESKILDGAKAENVMETLNFKRKSVLERDDLTARISFQGEDMDITKSNTVFIDQISDELHSKGVHTSDILSNRKSVSCRPKSFVPSDKGKLLDSNMEKPYANTQLSEGLINKSSVAKTIHNEDDMEMTRSHTVAFERKILDGVKAKNVTAEFLDVPEVDDLTSRISFQGEDMEITRSNTVFIDQISDQLHNKGVDTSEGVSKRKSICRKPLDTRNEMMLLVGNLEETNANVDLAETLVKKSSIDEGDMEMTRSYTVAIEGKISGGAKSKNVTTEFRDTRRKSVLDLTANAVDMSGDITSGLCSQGEDMDITKSNTVFIDQISGLLHDRSARVSLALSKRKSVSSRPKSLVPGDGTILLGCNMDETNANVRLAEGLENKVPVDKLLCNDGDMEISRSHTVAIENKAFETADIAYPAKTPLQVSTAVATPRPQAASNVGVVPPSVSKYTSYKDVSMPIETNDTTMNHSVSELSKLQGKILPLYGEETVFPSDDMCMDITDACSAAVEVNFSDDNPNIPYSSKAYGGKACEELMEMPKNSDLSEPTEKLETWRKSYARFLSLSVKSGIFVDGLGSGEPPQVHTSPVDEVSLLKPGPCKTETELIFDNGSQDTFVGFIDKEKRHTSSRNSILAKSNSKPTPTSGIGIDCTTESFEENGASAEKSVEVKSQLLRTKIVGLNTTSELRPVNVSLIQESNRFSLESSDIAPEGTKALEVAQELELKKNKLKGKRVSFYFPKSETLSKDEMLEQGSKSFRFPEMETVAKDEMLEEEERGDVEHQDGTVHASEDINDFGLIGQASVVCKTPPDTENLKDKPLHKEQELSKMNVLPKVISSKLEGFGIPAESSEGSRNRRRTIADVLLSIKRLTHKPKFSPHHTAPVSSLIDQLPTTSQNVCPSRSAAEQVLGSLELPNKETIQETDPTEKTSSISREHYLPSRRSVKIFLPKLPNKRASSTSNLDTVIASEAQPQDDRSTKVFPKTSPIDYGQCIDEEMLPDDGMFGYEVPEGAWEELCKNEALQNINTQTSQPKDSMTGQKRFHNIEHDSESQREKRGRLNDDEEQTSMAFKSADKSYRSDYSTPRASKATEQTCNSSQDSRADGMSVELSSQQCSQMDSQLPWDGRCEQSLWQNFQDGTITVQEFFALLGIRILIQKPRYSERPSKCDIKTELTPSEILLEQYVYQPKLQVYDEECQTWFQETEELRRSTELQHKPLAQVNSLLWEALKLCSENEIMCFGATLKDMKSFCSKKSKLLAHEAKVSMYSKLLSTAQMQKERLQERLSAADRLLEELDLSISSLLTDPVILDGEDRPDDGASGVRGCTQADIDDLQSQHVQLIQENSELKEKKEQLLAKLCSLQEEARVNDERLEGPSLSEWDLVKWTDTEATFNFLYDSLELSISFGDCIDGESFHGRPCRRVSCVAVESQLDDESAPPSTLLVHRLISQYVEKMSAFHETCKTQNDVPLLLFNLSLVVSRCKLLGEELEELRKWGAIYYLSHVHVQGQEVSLLFSSLATLVKFELIIHISETYPTAPLPFTLNNRIGSTTENRVAEIMASVPTGLWYLKRTVQALHENLLK